MASDLRNRKNPSFTTPEDEVDSYLDNLPAIGKTVDRLRRLMADNGDHTTTDTDGGDPEAVLPPTYIVVKVGKAPAVTVKWLIEKMKGRKRDGGAELIVMTQPNTIDDTLTLHISASKIKFLEIAEEMELCKTDRHGTMREFVVAELEEFLTEDMHVDDLLTTSERQTIVRHELENIRALAEDDHIPGFPNCILYEGQSILEVCLQETIVSSMFPLHDEEHLKKLGKAWYLKLWGKQPIEEIRLYFGESIALYFQFLAFYTKALLIPVLLGFLQIFVSIEETVPFFCVLNVVSVTLLLELWRRKSNEHAFKWGTIGMTSLDEPRPNFRGSMGVDAVSGRIQPQSPRHVTTIKMYCVSFPIVILCMIGAFLVMMVSFWAEDYMKVETSYQAYSMLPSIIYSILVCVLTLLYRKLATRLTEWENHRTQSQYDRHRVTKLVLFEFVNNFMSLFYIAFIIKDMDMLKSQLQTMLFVSQMICNFQETVLPLAVKYYTFRMLTYKTKKLNETPKNKLSKNYTFEENDHLASLPQLQAEDSRIHQVNQECVMEQYEGTFDDYLELWIQFGYVFMFSSVYPLAAVWALLNNIIEIRADAFKLCNVFQRPMSRRVKDIGAWQRCFEVLSALSIMTNCGILYLSPQMRSQMPNLSEVEWFLLFVLLEHLLLGIRYLLHITISDKPEWVRVVLARRNYESKQALKFERSLRNKRLLTRRFKTIHGPHRH